MIVPAGYVALREISTEFALEFSKFMMQHDNFRVRCLTIIDWIKWNKIEILLCSNTGRLCAVSPSIFWYSPRDAATQPGCNFFMVSLNDAFMTHSFNDFMENIDKIQPKPEDIDEISEYLDMPPSSQRKFNEFGAKIFEISQKKRPDFRGMTFAEHYADVRTNFNNWHGSRPNNQVVISRDDAARLRAHLSGFVKNAMAQQSKPVRYSAAKVKTKMIELLERERKLLDGERKLLDGEKRLTVDEIFTEVANAFPEVTRNFLKETKKEIYKENPNLKLPPGRPAKTNDK